MNDSNYSSLRLCYKRSTVSNSQRQSNCFNLMKQDSKINAIPIKNIK